jgi:hypothetical protein
MYELKRGFCKKKHYFLSFECRLIVFMISEKSQAGLYATVVALLSVIQLISFLNARVVLFGTGCELFLVQAYE